ncbi:MAG TPA: hypothetical protein VFJ51_02815 [Nitrososphaeraceae archaeon]|nr:hypothetical protein [Nitrososphaeraceae archaeon]
MASCYKEKMVDKDLTQREIHTISLEAILPTVIFLLSILVGDYTCQDNIM